MLFENKQDFVEIIETSIQNRWTGLFPKKQGNQHKPQDTTAERLRAWEEKKKREQIEVIDVEVGV